VAVIAFAAFPVVQLLAVNAGQVALIDAGRALLTSVLLALLALAVARLAIGHATKAALLVCGLLALFYSYGQVYDQLRSLTPEGITLGRHRYLLLAWAALAAGWGLLALKRAQQGWLHWMTGVGLVLLALPALHLLLTAGSSWHAAGALGTPELEEQQGPLLDSAYPDLCDGILDACAGEDVLRDF